MREQAAQKLAKAYSLDEIACSVATMQGASSLEEVASLVLQRNSRDTDAKYVHFFHEKIPSRQLAECTSLTPLNEVVAGRPTDPEPLRTRAFIRLFKGDAKGAVDDLTEALRLHRLYRPSHGKPRSPSQEGQLSGRQLQQQGVGRRQEEVILKEEDQPRSLELQVLFHRAGIYLGLACGHVAGALKHPASSSQGPADSGSPNAVDGDRDGGTQTEVDAGQPSEPEPSPAEREAQRNMAESRKFVRHHAKRALRDFIAFLSHFEYSPDLPIEIAEEFTRKVNSAVNGSRGPRSQSYPAGPRSPLQGEATEAPHRVFALSELFTSSPPAGLPPYPSTELALMPPQQPSSPEPVQTTTETLTCHPLLTEALHSLLLCHCLIQTSPKELLRHAYMVARLARLADGYPVFQSSRCPSRADWIEVLRAGNNWIQLAGDWEDLCAPAPLPLFQSAGSGSTPVPVSLTHPKQPRALPAPGNETAATGSPDSPASSARQELADKPRKDRIRHQAVLDALNDERVTDGPSLRLAIRARQLRAEHDYRLDNAVAALDAKLTRRELDSPSDDSPSSPTGAASSSNPNAATTSDAPPQPSTPPTDDSPTSPIVANGTGRKKPASTSTAATQTTTPTRPRLTAPTDEPAARDPYPISTGRAAAIARWVLEVPSPSGAVANGDGPSIPGAGAGRRRKKAVKKVKPAPGGSTGSAGLPGAVKAAEGTVEGQGEGGEERG